MAITWNGTLSYFDAESHIRATVWQQFGERQQKAAIAQAKRQLSRAIDDDIEDEIIDTDDHVYRPDYAVYEQALWLLENGVIADADNAAPAALSSDPEQSDGARDSQRGLLSPEALRWLGIVPGRIMLRRG